MKSYPQNIIIEEQGLRDGLQSETLFLPTDKKLELIRAVADAGLKRIQVTSFVHPKLVPQMADAEDICKGLDKRSDVLYSALVLNTKGLERAANAGLKHVAASISASDTHSRKNANASLPEARKRIAEMIQTGQALGLTIRGGLQCVFGCRFEGRIDPDVVFDMIKEQLDLGVEEVALADSTGMANPSAIQDISGRVIELAEGRPVCLHLHDTEGKGLANALAAIQIGVTHFDTAFGGTGGCPFIKGASGNISTEDLAFMVGQMGIETGIDIEKIAAISRSLEAFFSKSFSGKIHRVIDRKDIQVCAN
ncbi:MAG: hydroxymethylglutaryl-CoA lyase [Deltaproteobacteria bacterium]|nr:MAG: hydroxymethylglutaryl-CoA lyase [Deltaproteobacteria bacterium]